VRNDYLLCLGAKAGDQPAKEKCGRDRSEKLAEEKTRNISEADSGECIGQRSCDGNRGIGERSGSGKPICRDDIPTDCKRNGIGTQAGTKLGAGTLPGDFAAIASGINNKGQVVGSTLDSTFNFDARAFIWQDNVMTDLSTLFPASSNLYPTMANQINERGEIVGMATVLSGPHEGETHAFLATPVDERIDKSIEDVAPTHPKSNLSANVGKQLLQRLLGRGRFDRQ
jgi:probable HAF family extracellular repeat protein